MLVSKNAKICVTPTQILRFALPPTRILRFALTPTRNPKANQWNIGCVGFQTQNFHIGHVHLIFLGVDFIRVGSRFSVEYGLYLLALGHCVGLDPQCETFTLLIPTCSYQIASQTQRESQNMCYFLTLVITRALYLCCAQCKTQRELVDIFFFFFPVFFYRSSSALHNRSST